MATRYAVELWDDSDGDGTVYCEADDDAEAIDDARSEAVDWPGGGDWGPDGVRVEVRYTVSRIDADSGEWTEIHSGDVSVDVEPDHEALIRAAGGDTECDHDWSSEGEGGCDENPGVWSRGGTTIATTEHCTLCGLVRTEVSRGSQRNPGESDTTEYYQPAAE